MRDDTFRWWRFTVYLFSTPPRWDCKWYGNARVLYIGVGRWDLRINLA